MKNILITGGSGFLGSYIAKRVLPNANSVTIVTLDIKQKTTLKALLNYYSMSMSLIRYFI